MDTLIIVDLEATCWKKKPPPGQISEIIEIGVCTLDIRTLKPYAKRSILVKPTVSTVSPFCTELTSLTQEDVDAGVSFAEACSILKTEYTSPEHTWGSWGGYDARMFTQQCKASNQEYPFSPRHVNLKRYYAHVTQVDRRIGMARALRQAELTLEGTHHRGHDDAWNTARLLAHTLQQHGVESLVAFMEENP